MSIASEISRIQGAKADLKTSIEAKGVTVPSSALIDTYSGYVDQISGGGGGYTGHVDTVGLTALGWDSDDIQWLQDHVWWNAEDDAEWAVSQENLKYGPTGSSPITWSSRAIVQNNPEVKYFPKLPTPPGNNIQFLFSYYTFICAIPTHGWNMTGKTALSQMFNGCTNLRSLGDISNWDVSAVTTFRGAFAFCFSLKSIDISGWDTSACTTFNEMFGFCRSLEEIDLSGLDLAACTTMASMFQYCISLKRITGLSNKNAPVLTTMQSFGYYCLSLEELIIENFNAPLLNTIQYLTAYSTIKNLKLGFVGSAIANMQYAFVYDKYLRTINATSLDLTSCAQSGVGTGDFNSPFSNCQGVTECILGNKFFAGSFTTLYASNLAAWTRDSVYASLYTNQTLRNSSSPAVTVRLGTSVYDSLSQQDKDDIATKNITLNRG